MNSDTLEELSENIEGFDNFSSEQQAAMEFHRAEMLGPDIISTSHKIKQAKGKLTELNPQFEMGGICGVFAPVTYSCRLKHSERQYWNSVEQTGFANYPFMMLETNELPLWQNLTNLGSEALDEEGDINVGNLNSNSINNALRLYDQVLGESLDASLDAVDTICDDKEEAGLSVLFNPMLAQSYFNDPENKQKGWVFCTLYSEEKRDEAAWNVLKTGGMVGLTAASIMVTGGIAGFALAAADFGLVAYQSVQRYDHAHQMQNEYLAGVGDVGLYLQAQDSLNSFYRDLAIDVGLSSLGLVGEGLMARNWLRARRLARANRTVNLPGELNGQMMNWYRSKMRQTFGRRAQNLTDDEILTLARMEDSGEVLEGFADLDELRRGISLYQQERRAFSSIERSLGSISNPGKVNFMDHLKRIIRGCE